MARQPFDFAFTFPINLRRVLPIPVVSEVIGVGGRLKDKWLQEREQHPTAWGNVDGKYWQNKVFRPPREVPGFESQPLWRRKLCLLNMDTWMTFCNALPSERNDPVYMPYPRRIGVDFDPSVHGRYDFPIIYNPNCTNYEDALTFTTHDLYNTLVHFLDTFSSCPDPAFITVCNYFRLLRILLRIDPTPQERNLPPLFFDPNMIDSCAMARLMMRATLLPSFCLALLEDMSDSRFTVCNHPFLSTTTLQTRLDLHKYLQGRPFLNRSRKPQPPSQHDQSAPQ